MSRIEFVYRKGERHNNADALSRKNCTTCSQCQTLHKDAKTLKPKAKMIMALDKDNYKWQKDNEEIENIRLSIKNGNSEFFEEDNIIRTMDDKIWIPKSLRKDFIIDCHSKLCHAGVKKCQKYLDPYFAMESMKNFLKDVIEACEIS